MTALLILGAGGHGKVVADAAMQSGAWRCIAFADDRPIAASRCLGLPVVCRWDEVDRQLQAYPSAIVAIGHNRRRLDMLAKLKAYGFKLPSIIHRAATVSPHAVIHEGSVVFAGSVISAGAVVGAGSIVNTGVTVDHDCDLGAGVHLSPGVHLAGAVTVNECAWVGIGACVIAGCSIGADAVIGAGAVVLNDVPNAATVFGVPARQKAG